MVLTIAAMEAVWPALAPFLDPASLVRFGHCCRASMRCVTECVYPPSVHCRHRGGGELCAFLAACQVLEIADHVWTYHRDHTHAYLSVPALRPHLRCDGDPLYPDHILHSPGAMLTERDGLGPCCCRFDPFYIDEYACDRGALCAHGSAQDKEEPEVLCAECKDCYMSWSHIGPIETSDDVCGVWLWRGDVADDMEDGDPSMEGAQAVCMRCCERGFG